MGSHQRPPSLASSPGLSPPTAIVCRGVGFRQTYPPQSAGPESRLAPSTSSRRGKLQGAGTCASQHPIEGGFSQRNSPAFRRQDLGSRQGLSGWGEPRFLLPSGPQAASSYWDGGGPSEARPQSAAVGGGRADQCRRIQLKTERGLEAWRGPPLPPRRPPDLYPPRVPTLARTRRQFTINLVPSAHQMAS